MIDLLLKNGTVIDPSQKINKKLSVAINNGKILDLTTEPDKYEAKQIKDIEGKLVFPGLIDLHTHIFYGGTPSGVNINDDFYSAGVTAYVDAGSAGAGNYEIFNEFILSNSKYKTFAFLNLFYPGLINTSHWIPRHNRNPIHYASIPAAMEMIEKYPQDIIGLKVMASSDYNYHGLTAVRLGIEASKHTKKPVMVHFSCPPSRPADILPLLNENDILTHSFRGRPNSCLTEDDKPIPEIIDAKKRGVIIDIGHGEGSFSVEVARKMLEQGLYPDVISSDMHSRSINGPAFNLSTTMSKFLSLGMSLNDVVEASTWTPARVINKQSQLGTLKQDTVADLAVFELKNGNFDYYDAIYEGAEIIKSNKFTGDKFLKHIMTVLDGKLLEQK